VDLSAALCVFRSCGQLQYLLAFVRDVANTMNASAVQGGTAVEGLKLDSLSRLQVRLGYHCCVTHAKPYPRLNSACWATLGLMVCDTASCRRCSVL
jgi:hypothetical protein